MSSLYKKRLEQWQGAFAQNLVEVVQGADDGMCVHSAWAKAYIEQKIGVEARLIIRAEGFPAPNEAYYRAIIRAGMEGGVDGTPLKHRIRAEAGVHNDETQRLDPPVLVVIPSFVEHPDQVLLGSNTEVASTVWLVHLDSVNDFCREKRKDWFQGEPTIFGYAYREVQRASYPSNLSVAKFVRQFPHDVIQHGSHVVDAVDDDQPKLQRRRLPKLHAPAVNRLLRVTFLPDSVRVKVCVDALDFSIKFAEVFLGPLKPDAESSQWISIGGHVSHSQHEEQTGPAHIDAYKLPIEIA